MRGGGWAALQFLFASAATSFDRGALVAAVLLLLGVVATVAMNQAQSMMAEVLEHWTRTTSLQWQSLQSMCDTLHSAETCGASWLCSWEPGTLYGGTCSGVHSAWEAFLAVTALTPEGASLLLYAAACYYTLLLVWVAIKFARHSHDLCPRKLDGTSCDERIASLELPEDRLPNELAAHGVDRELVGAILGVDRAADLFRSLGMDPQHDRELLANVKTRQNKQQQQLNRPASSEVTVDCKGGGDFESLQAALDSSRHVSTVIVRGGVYVETDLQIIGRNDFCIQAEENASEKVVLRLSCAPSWLSWLSGAPVGLLIRQSHHVTISGIELHMLRPHCHGYCWNLEASSDYRNAL